MGMTVEQIVDEALGEIDKLGNEVTNRKKISLRNQQAFSGVRGITD